MNTPQTARQWTARLATWVAAHRAETLVLAGFAVCWAGFLHQLHFNWAFESYYSFGWFVVPMTFWLARARWLDESRSWAGSPPGRSRGLLLASGVLLALHLPFRVAVDINPFWRLPLWGAAITLIAATELLILFLLGRRAAWSLAFPVAFLATMLPWPSIVEGTVINSMTRVVVAANVEVLRLLGHPADAQGNVIMLGSSAVGVDDACSGIRSLQTLGMLALFVGEFWRLTVVRRISLFVVAALAAFAFNVCRALALALCVFHGGHDLYATWHDPAGYISLAGSSSVLLFAAWRLGRTPVPVPPVSVTGGVAADRARLGWAGAAALSLLGLSASGAPALWFMQGESTGGPKFGIAVHWPQSAPYACTALAIDDRVREILGYDYGERLAIRTGSTGQAEIWHYGFNGESGSKSIAAYIHSPTICMTANGAQLQNTHDRLNVDLGPFSLSFQHFTFRSAPASGSRPIQVFWCMWEGVSAEHFAHPNDFRSVVLNALKSRHRNLERSVILIGVHNETPETARRAVTRLVHRSVSPVVDGRQISYQK